MTTTHTMRRLALVAVAAMLAALLPLSGAYAQDAQDGDQDIALDLEADTNVQYAITWSRLAYPDDAVDAGDGPTTALLGRDDLFPDNLSAGQLADDSPLLLTPSDALSDLTLTELQRLGVTDVTILGGEAAISTDVEEELTDAGFTVTRIEGPTRTETAIAAAEANTEDNDTAILARSHAGEEDPTQAFADSLAAGVWAGADDFDLLLTLTDELTPSTAAQIAAAEYTRVVIVGGTAAVSQAVEDEVAAMVDTVDRVAGPTRFDTAVEIANARGFEDSSDAEVTLLVDGQGADAWADAFPAAGLGAPNNYPLVLSNSADDALPQATADFLVDDGAQAAFANHLAEVDLICGPTVPDADDSTDQCGEAAALMGLAVDTVPFEEEEPPPPDGFPDNETGLTDRPELIRADAGELVTNTQSSASNPPGLRVTYTYDEGISSVNAANFRVHAANGTEYVGTSATISTTDNTMVTVIFDFATGQAAPATNTQATVDTLTIATSDRNAVFDFQGNFGVQGDFPLGAAGTTVVGAAGITNAPDPLSFGNFRQAQVATQTAVDVTLDENAWSVNNGQNFQLIPANHLNPIILCMGPNGPGDTTAAGGTVPGGNGTTTLTIVCDHNPANTTTLVPANFARGIVNAGALQDMAIGGNTNITQAAPVTGGPGFSTGPDLASGSFAFDAVVQSVAYDAAVFNFDNNINPATVNFAALTAYDANRNIINPVAPQPQPAAQQVSGSQVLVYYPDGSLANAIGLQAPAAAVTDTGGIANRVDEVGVENTSSTGQAPGATSDPELTAVNVALSTPTIGTPSNQATYVYDEDVAAVIGNVGGHDLFLPDGTALVATACQRGTTEDTDHTVTCTAYNVLGGAAATSAQIGEAVVGGVDANSVQAETGGAGNTVGSEVVNANA